MPRTDKVNLFIKTITSTVPKINLKTQFGRNCSSCSRQGHRAWILEVGHDHCRNGEHEAAHDLEKNQN